MAYIQLDENLPGLLSLLEYRHDTAKPIRELTQFLLRGPSSLSEGERELIAALVSYKNQCKFCTASHTALADLFLGEPFTAAEMKHNLKTVLIDEKLRALLQIAALVQQNGQNVTNEAIEKAKAEGATDIEIHDTVLIASLFSMCNRYVDGLNTFTPSQPAFYREMAEKLATTGYA
ncbi:MAG: carboxymuconolactone decarboxylase [Bacteroidetes bacterium]|nr:MAG: carboxymuconolactone decarboxylase [Bacteroidota bacterium]